MKIKDVALKSLAKTAASKNGLCIKIGPFVIRLRTQEKSFLRTFALLYQDFQIAENEFADFNIQMRRPSAYRRWVKAQILFCVDGVIPFEPFPLDHAMPLFEWGLNWCIGRQAHQYLMLHSGVVEKQGQAIILPALPGSGKSTLSSALGLSGWRFFSDEFGLVRASDGMLQAMPRPVPLKNESIQVIRDFSSSAVLGPVFPKTRKGTVSHLRAPSCSVEQSEILAKPTLLIFPRYEQGAKTEINEVAEHYAFVKLSTNAFNYDVMGLTGFKLVSDIVSSCRCLNLVYSNLDDVIGQLDDMVSKENANG